jgi:hypothetical protein
MDDHSAIECDTVCRDLTHINVHVQIATSITSVKYLGARSARVEASRLNDMAPEMVKLTMI